MSSLTEVFNAGAANFWVLAPSAVALGALHGLEPGHSKTMMAAFIVAVRGTVAQAALLGLSATVSHTAVVWIVALTGLYFGSKWGGEASEPWLQIASGALILSVAAWMAYRTWRGGRERAHDHHDDHDHHHHGHDHDHDHDHHRHDHGDSHEHDHRHDDDHAPDQAAETTFEDDFRLIDPEDSADAHEREHALEINRRFANQNVTTGQIVLFGLTGGLIPCPASITVLLLCLQVGKMALGAALVLCFSVGLALTMVAVGVGAALGLRHISSRWPGLEALAARAPYFSGVLTGLVGLYTIYLGVSALA